MIQLDVLQEVISYLSNPSNQGILLTGVPTSILAIWAIFVSMQTQHNVKLEYLASFLPQPRKKNDQSPVYLYLENIGSGIAVCVDLEITGYQTSSKSQWRALKRFCHFNRKHKTSKTSNTCDDMDSHEDTNNGNLDRNDKVSKRCFFRNTIRPQEEHNTGFILTKDYAWCEITGTYLDTTGGTHDDVYIGFYVKSDSSLEIKEFKM